MNEQLLLAHDSIRRGRRLEYLGLGWNIGEAVVAIGAGVFAGSTALLGFGIDSVIESLSGAVLLWRLAHGVEGERREQMTFPSSRLTTTLCVMLGLKRTASVAGSTERTCRHGSPSLIAAA